MTQNWEDVYKIVHDGLAEKLLPEGSYFSVGTNTFVVKKNDYHNNVYSTTLECLTLSQDEAKDTFDTLAAQGVIKGYQFVNPRRIGFREALPIDFMDKANSAWWRADE